MIPIFFPIFVRGKIHAEIITIDKYHFKDDRGYDMVKWGNDESALTTFENLEDFINLAQEKLYERHNETSR